jgi:hypothetical protein
VQVEQEEEKQQLVRNGRRIVQDSDDEGGEGEQDAEGEMDVSTIDPAQLQQQQQQNHQYQPQDDENPAEAEEEEEGVRPRRATTSRVKIADSEDEDFEEDEGAQDYRRPSRVMKTASGRTTKRPDYYDEPDDDEEVTEKPTSGRLTRGGNRRNGGYRGEGIEEDEEEWAAEDGLDDSDEFGTRRTRNSGRNTRSSNNRRSSRSSARNLRNRAGPGRPSGRQTRTSLKAQDTSYDEQEHGSSDEEDLSLELNDDDDDDLSFGGGAAPRRNLRQKKKVDYFAPLSLEAPRGMKDKKKNQFNKKRNDDGNPFAGLPANLTGAQWAALYPDGGQPSDSVRFVSLVQPSATH